MKPITILHVIDTMGTGGSERQLRQTLSRLNHRGFRNVLCVLQGHNDYPARIVQKEVEVHSLDLTDRYDLFRGVSRLKHLIDRVQAELIHTTLYRATLIGRLAGRLTARPVLTTLVNTPYEKDWRIDDPQLNWTKVEAMLLLDWLTSRWTTQYAAITHVVKQSYMRHLGIPETRIAVIPRGIAAGEVPRLDAEDVAAARATLGCSNAAPLLLTVGRLVPQKGQQYVISAMPAVLNVLPRARLAIAGEGRLRGALERQIESLGLGGTVQLLGDRRDVFRLLAAADVFVFPSISEGFGVALLEAMACGKPCIVSATPSLREVTGGDGARLVAPRSPQVLAEAIIALARDPEACARLGQAARRRAQRFDLDQSVRRLEDLYRLLAAPAASATALADDSRS